MAVVVDLYGFLLVGRYALGRDGWMDEMLKEDYSNHFLQTYPERSQKMYSESLGLWEENA